MRAIIIGAGPGGICAGYRLLQAGFSDFTILEKAGGIGGTWWNNSYPGCRCDVPSHFYSFSFAPKADWTEPYATQGEIQAYLEDCAMRFGLLPHIRLNCAVTAAARDDAAGLWCVKTSTGEEFAAEVLIGAPGLFNEPAMPDIPGLADFSGPVLHTARWDHAVPLAGRRIAMIGSAASAVQAAPELAEVAEHLTIYQRTPNYVSARDNEFSREFLDALAQDPDHAVAAERAKIAGWLDAICPMDNAEAMAAMEQACRDNLAHVADPVLREKLTPRYPFGAKRGLVSSDWYPMFNRPNVELVTDGITHVTASGICTGDGRERAFDVIVLATGFETSKFLSAIPVTGSGGRTLAEEWRDGARAYLGITAPGFPNLFMLYGPNTNNGSIIHQIECQVDYTTRKLTKMRQLGLAAIDLKREALDAYNAQLQADLAKVAVWHSGVNDYYRAASGLLVTQWPHSMSRYEAECQRDDLMAYDVVAAAVQSERTLWP